MFRDTIERQVASYFRDDGVDAERQDVEDIAHSLLELSAVDVAEIYTPLRFTPGCNRLGLRPGFVVDLTTKRPDGQYWDLSRDEDVEELKTLQRAGPDAIDRKPAMQDFLYTDLPQQDQG